MATLRKYPQWAAKAIAELRTRGMSEKALAKELRYHPKSLSRALSGRYVSANIRRAVCTYLGIEDY